MKRRHVTRMMAVVTAMGLTVTTPMTAMAETISNSAGTETVVEYVEVVGSGTETIDGDVANSDGDYAVYMGDDVDYSGGTWKIEDVLDGSVTITGDVSVDDKNNDVETWIDGVYIESEGGKGSVTIGGDITVSSKDGRAQGINADGSSEGAGANTNINIEVGGDINAASDNSYAKGIRIESGVAGEITVHGDIKANGAAQNETDSSNHGILVNKNESGKTEPLTIAVDGDVTAEGYHGRGIVSNDKGRAIDIKIGGNVSGSQHGIGGNDNCGKTSITVGGDVSGGEAGVTWGNDGGEMHIIIDGNVSSEGVGIASSTENGGKTDIEIGGEVKSSGNQGIWIGGSDADIALTVGKGITVSNESGKLTVEGLGISGSIRGAEDTDISHIDAKINGDIVVTSKEHRAVGIEVAGAVEGDITVNGDIKAKGDDKPEEEESIKGNSEAFGINFAKTEISSEQPITITVGGDVLAEGYNACAVYGENYKGTALLSVDGDITGSRWGVGLAGDGDVDVVTTGTISHQGGADGSSIWLSIKESTDDVPSVTAWKIEGAGDGTLLQVKHNGEAVSDEKKADIVKEYADKALAAINYIIKGSVTENGKETDNGTIVLTGASGTVTVGDKTYETAHQGESIKISVKTVDGYKYSISDGQGLLTKNSDGTYTLRVPEGGGVDLKAVIEKIENQRREDRDSDDSDSSSGSGGSSGSGSSSGSSGTGIAAKNAKGPGALVNAEGSWIAVNGGNMFMYSDGSYAAGSNILTSDGTTKEHLGWVRSNDRWYAFGADAVMKTGWVRDEYEDKWYYCDINNGMNTGWMLSTEDGYWYYLDPATGCMLTGWQTINGKKYYLGANSAAAGHPYGALYINGTTPDGFSVDADGARV